ncbi:MAG: hypothetical protein M2R45_03223 [Verrucomicrobia subdivision 3 bacterium]|nr:hypothetical protein [Limisphaerales bacterium]
MKTDRPRRTGQGLKLTLAGLLTALALQPDAAAQSVAVSNLGQSWEWDLPLYNGESTAIQFTVGPLPEGLTDWTLNKITGSFSEPQGQGTPGSFEASILRDTFGAPGSLDSPLTVLSGDQPRTIREYEFVPPAGTTVFLEPETSYWLTYTSAGLPSEDDFYILRATDVPNEDAGSLQGWSIGDDHWYHMGEGWVEVVDPNGLRLPYQFSVSAVAVPEPSEYALFFALGLGAFALWHRRRQAGQRAAA